jgi:pSer/pThr/pTyr-binding forkhead associated (FHA) protein
MAVSESKVLYRLKVLDPTMTLSMGSEIDIFLDRIILGRGAHANLRYSEKWLSVGDEHAVIKVLGNRILLENAYTRNQVLLNGKKVQKERRLKPGDTIQLSVGGPRVKILEIGKVRSSSSGYSLISVLFYATMILGAVTAIFLIWWLLKN